MNQTPDQAMYVYTTASALNTMKHEEVEQVFEQLDTEVKGLLYQLLTNEIAD